MYILPMYCWYSADPTIVGSSLSTKCGMQFRRSWAVSHYSVGMLTVRHGLKSSEYYESPLLAEHDLVRSNVVLRSNVSTTFSCLLLCVMSCFRAAEFEVTLCCCSCWWWWWWCYCCWCWRMNAFVGSNCGWNGMEWNGMEYYWNSVNTGSFWIK